MLSCKDFVKIVSSEDPPSWGKRLQMSLHVMMCRHCRAYVKQLEMIKGGVRSVLNSNSKVDEKKIKDIEDRAVEKIKE